jgi:hypothetical protein
MTSDWDYQALYNLGVEVVETCKPYLSERDMELVESDLYCEGPHDAAAAAIDMALAGGYRLDASTEAKVLTLMDDAPGYEYLRYVYERAVAAGTHQAPDGLTP